MVLFRRITYAVMLLILLYLITSIILKNRSKVSLILIPLVEFIKTQFLLGSLLYMFAFGVLTSVFVPTTVLSVTAGIVFKPMILAVGICLIGYQISIVLSFLTGRFMLRPYVLKLSRSDRRVNAIDKAIESDGFKVVALLRMTPVFPCGIINLLFSGTGLSLKTIMLGSLVGNLPGTILNCMVGAMIGNIADSGNHKTPPRIRALTLLFSFVFTITAFVFVGILAKKALRNVVDLEDQVDLEAPKPLSDEVHSPKENDGMLPLPNPDSISKGSDNSFTKAELRMILMVGVGAVVTITIGIPVILMTTPAL